MCMIEMSGSNDALNRLRVVLSRTMRPEELDDAIEWATRSGEDEESIRAFLVWGEEYGPTTELEVAQMSFHLVKPGVWRRPERGMIVQDEFEAIKDFLSDSL